MAEPIAEALRQRVVCLVGTVMFPKIPLYTFPIFSFILFCWNLQEYRALLPYVQCSQIVSDTR
jgi:hypothetical protein